jgi:hypothetical protein
MKVNLSFFNTLPNNKERFWQIVVLPTISFLNYKDIDNDYNAINLEWLFWSMTILIENDKRTISKS